jgi:hypothetical protein
MLFALDFSGIVTSDRYGGCNRTQREQLCWAHLLRGFQSRFDADRKAKPIGRRLTDSALTQFHHWNRNRDGSITRGTMRRNIRRLCWPVCEALKAGTLQLRGKLAGICQHIPERVDCLWKSLDPEDVKPTNNASKLSLRNAVIRRKLSFGT